MKIASVSATNFASYKELNFEFDNQGLCLIQGSTGAGKSTLMDLVPYCLFGVTAKDGAADDVIPFCAEGPTEVTIQLEGMTIFRSRKPNDLWYCVYKNMERGTEIRGKDLNDTQKQINELLGITAETYLSGAYFHEFAKSAQFFTATAKNRRMICEQIVDLTLAKNLQLKASNAAKKLKQEQIEAEIRIAKLESDVNHLSEAAKEAADNNTRFDIIKEARVQEAGRLCYKFEDERENTIERLQRSIVSNKDISFLEDYVKSLEDKIVDNQCKLCGNHLDAKFRMEVKEQKAGLLLKKQNNKMYKNEIELTQGQSNPYLPQLERENSAVNTFADKAVQLINDHKQVKAALSYQKSIISSILNQISDIDVLSRSVETLRGKLITTTIDQIQYNVNTLLSKHFDAEIKVLFDVVSADKLDITIHKDGNTCSYTQLSKGQRQLLKLCFGVSVMKAVSNNSGVNFNALFFDEALSGLDETLKRKSFDLFEELSQQHSSVFVIDHNNEFKTLFNKKYQVELIDGKSIIHEET